MTQQHNKCGHRLGLFALAETSLRHTHTHTHTHAHTRTDARAHTHTHTLIHTRPHMHTHTSSHLRHTGRRRRQCVLEQRPQGRRRAVGGERDLELCVCVAREVGGKGRRWICRLLMQVHYEAATASLGQIAVGVSCSSSFMANLHLAAYLQECRCITPATVTPNAYRTIVWVWVITHPSPDPLPAFPHPRS